eukprot:maker-scaffold_11-snap-gene-12.5-mRNA-1 protein AED:0.12 eAED:0.12 QI:105/1/1/1/1/1/2/171/299
MQSPSQVINRSGFDLEASSPRKLNSSGRSQTSLSGSNKNTHLSYAHTLYTSSKNFTFKSSDSTSTLKILKMYFKRMSDPKQMDINYSLKQMLYLIKSPSKVYKLTSWRKQTKDQWARDDPGFLFLLLLLIITGSFFLSLFAGGPSRFTQIVPTILRSLLLFLFTSFAISYSLNHVSNSFFRIKHSHSAEQKVEILYSFDVHCNSLFPFLLFFYVPNMVFIKMLTSEKFLLLFVTNSIYAGFGVYYFYLTFLGYLYLPFLDKERVMKLMYPVGAVMVVYVLCLLFKININNFMLSWIYGF